MSRKPKNESTSIPITAHVHKKDKRTNIPTRELQHFVKDDEEKPRPLLYPRKPELDPQLVWKGKDEQDAKGLSIPTVPVYIQEKIAPQAIIENLRIESQKDATQPSLFSDFNGIEFEKLIDFYKHTQNWSNRLILGDSLLVMSSLAEKEGLKGKVQMVYFDPPYGIDFSSNWQVSTRKRQVRDGKAEDLTRQPEQIKAFRDTWELGIHSYLAYLRDRLTVCRDLLSESGSMFVQIGDQNVHLVRCVLDEVFGPTSHVVTIVVKKKGSQKSSLIDPVNDYILWYCRSAEGRNKVKYRPLYEPRELDAETVDEFRRVELADGRDTSLAELSEQNKNGTDYRIRPSQLFKDFPGARLFRPWPITNGGDRANQMDPIQVGGKKFLPPRGNCWRHTTRTDDGSTPGMTRLLWAGRLVPGDTALDYKRYLDDFPFKTISNWWDGLGGASNPVYVVQTNNEIIKRCMLMTTDPGDLVLDPTCGSGTTAVVAEEWGRRWITTDTSRVALALARTRLMSTRFPYYLLSDSKEGEKKEAEISGKLMVGGGGEGDIRKGFVYKRALQITSGTIASTQDIKKGMSRADLEAAIAKQAETELLYDQPYEDSKRVRVSGPFTVESLSPHRVLGTDSASTSDERARERDGGELQFAAVILENLRKAGVQNTFKKQRLTFDRLEAFAGVFLHAAGEYTEGGKSKRVAVCIGPEHGTVGPELVKDAAKEAVKGVGFDLLVVCGFAFDPHVGETGKEFGKLTVLMARMNPDLAMGDELLKKTGAGNLFMIFGEPDLDVKKQKDGKLVVEIKGVDVYDPTTGEIRSHSTDDIAAWFIDTDYNEESFFVRHAYFCGADAPYEKLKRALRASVDENAWASLYSTKSRPFDIPKKGKIAVKVINHYGDEVLKVYSAK